MGEHGKSHHPPFAVPHPEGGRDEKAVDEAVDRPAQEHRRGARAGAARLTVMVVMIVMVVPAVPVRRVRVGERARVRVVVPRAADAQDEEEEKRRAQHQTQHVRIRRRMLKGFGQKVRRREREQEPRRGAQTGAAAPGRRAVGESERAPKGRGAGDRVGEHHLQENPAHFVENDFQMEGRQVYPANANAAGLSPPRR